MRDAVPSDGAGSAFGTCNPITTRSCWTSLVKWSGSWGISRRKGFSVQIVVAIVVLIIVDNDWDKDYDNDVSRLTTTATTTAYGKMPHNRPRKGQSREGFGDAGGIVTRAT